MQAMDCFLLEKKLHSRLRLWEFDNQYILESLEGEHLDHLMISRKTGRMQFVRELPGVESQKACRRQTVFGFLGILRLFTEAYALIVTSREQIGTYFGSCVYKITSMKFLRCESESGPLTEIQTSDEGHLRSLLQCLEATPGLYMSYDADLTHRVQASLSLERNQSLWQQVDARFVWNKQLWDDLYEHQFDSFALPVIQGSFQTFETELQEKLVKVSLIARRCNRRIGTRMWRRGANLNGDVANFVETEQILQSNGFVASYVQVRGSIPVLWEQVVDLSYKPQVKLFNLDETPKVVERHFQDLIKRYGSVVAVDLVNQHGGEAVLGMAYANAMKNVTAANENIHYISFDFHRICGQLNFDRLSYLYEELQDKLSKQGYFLMIETGKMLEKQNGVVRLNCIDCLDRTNVTQSLLGRKCLEIQLQRSNIFAQSDSIKKFPDFDTKFKTLWADHGDNISIQYSGTSALKGDFVRFGKRTVIGLLKDGYSALARYYYNNLYDGKMQDALDLAAGHYIATRGFYYREERTLMRILTYFPLVAAAVFAGLVFTMKSLRNVSQDNYHQLLYALLWGSLTIGITALVRSNGRQFTSRPYLCKLD